MTDERNECIDNIIETYRLIINDDELIESRLYRVVIEKHIKSGNKTGYKEIDKVIDDIKRINKVEKKHRWKKVRECIKDEIEKKVENCYKRLERKEQTRREIIMMCYNSIRARLNRVENYDKLEETQFKVEEILIIHT